MPGVFKKVGQPCFGDAGAGVLPGQQAGEIFARKLFGGIAQQFFNARACFDYAAVRVKNGKAEVAVFEKGFKAACGRIFFV